MVTPANLFVRTPRQFKLGINARLRAIHSALDDALGDTDITHVEDDDDLRQEHPVQWAAQRLALVIRDLEA